MDDIINSIIESKLFIAQTNEEITKLTHKIREISEKIADADEEKGNLNRQFQSLLKSINELIEIKNSFREELESAKDIVEESRSLEFFLETPLEATGIEIWTELLLELESPQWFKRVKSLSRRGIPAKMRGEVWGRIIGNDLFITPKLFASLLETAKHCDKSEQEDNGTILIPMDLKRTLSNLQVFQEKQPLNKCLSDLLKTFAVKST